MGVWPASTVIFNNVEVPYLEPADDDYFDEPYWSYDGSALTVTVNLPTPVSITESAKLKVSPSPSFYLIFSKPLFILYIRLSPSIASLSVFALINRSTCAGNI